MEQKLKKNGFWTSIKFIGLLISSSPFLFILYQFSSDKSLIRDAMTTPAFQFIIIVVVGVTIALVALGVIIFNVAKLYERK